MECPFCGEDMETGFIYSTRKDMGIPWLPESGRGMKGRYTLVSKNLPNVVG